MKQNFQSILGAVLVVAFFVAVFAIGISTYPKAQSITHGNGDHGGSTGLTDDDHVRYLDTSADDTFSDGTFLWSVTADTSDASDTKGITFNGGGADTSGRGAQWSLYGNEYASLGGTLDMFSGNMSTAKVNISTTNALSSMTLKAEDGGTDNKLVLSSFGFQFTGNAGDTVKISEETDLAIEETGGTDLAIITVQALSASKTFDIVDAADNSVFMMAPPSATATHGISMAADGDAAATDTGTLTCALQGLTCLRTWDTDITSATACGTSRTGWYNVACVE